MDGRVYFGAGDDDFVFGSRVPADVNAALMQLRSLFSENGSIVFAQCEVGKGDSGRQTLQTVADLAGVPTVGSQGLYHDLTGFDVAPFAMLPRRP